jgi:hypothetical protein
MSMQAFPEPLYLFFGAIRVDLLFLLGNLSSVENLVETSR